MNKQNIVAALLLGLVALFPLTARAQYEWQGPFTVAAGNCGDFVIDETTGNLHIVTGIDYVGLIYTVLDSVGGRISRQILVPNIPEGNLNWGPTIALDSHHQPHIFFKSRQSFLHTDRGAFEPSYDISYIHKNENGWSSPMRVAKEVWRGYMVRMVLDAQDRVHVVWSEYIEDPTLDGPYGRVIYNRFEEGVLTNTQTISRDNTYDYRVDNRMEIAYTTDGVLHIVFGNPDYHAGIRGISYYRSSDGGNNWTFAEDLFGYFSGQRAGSPDIFVSGDDNVHFVYGVRRSSDALGMVYYARYHGSSKEAAYKVTGDWALPMGWSNASVAATTNSEYIGVAYMSHRGYGALYTRFSTNGGVSWSPSVELVDETSDSDNDGRDVHLLRAYHNHFYMIVPHNNETVLYILRNLGDTPCVADLGGPYQGEEGSVISFDGSGSTDTGLNPGIVQYAWDWNSDGVADSVTTTARLDLVFHNEIQAEMILTVTDQAVNTDADTAAYEVVNAPPRVDITGPRTVNENDTLRLVGNVYDPGEDDTFVLQWDLTDGLTSDTTHIKVVFRDDSQRVITLTATDDDGASAQDTAQVRVVNLPPVADSGGPYRVAPNENLTVTGSGVDPGPLDVVTGHWDLDYNGAFEVDGFTTHLSFTTIGVYQIVFEARDDDGGFMRDTTDVVVANEAPTVKESLSGQTINEGGLFADVTLDEFVVDNEHTPDRLNWTVSGYQDLLVTLTPSRVLQVAVPDSEWAGQETLRLIVADPSGLKDTADVAYTVRSINDAPHWLGTLAYTFNEDDTLKVPLSLLQTLVADPDHKPSELTFTVTENAFIDGAVFEELGLWQFWGAPDWYGNETLQWVVTDPEGATDRLTLPFVVHGIADAPEPFNVLTPANFDSTAWPEFMRFKWQSTTDPDSNDAVFYVLHIGSQGGGASWSYQSPTLTDTTFLFQPSDAAEAGVYFWWVEARDVAGHLTESRNNGTIFVRTSAVEEPENISVPDEFRLLQNHPNPFNPETQITYHLPQAAPVTLLVYNMLGQVVRTLVDSELGPGVHTAIWNGRDEYGNIVPTGVYLCRMTSGTHTFMRKMMLMQ